MTKAWIHAMKLDRRDAADHQEQKNQRKISLGFSDAMTDAIHQQFAALLRGDHGIKKQKIAKSLVDPEAYQILGQESGSGLDGDTGEFLMGAEKKDKKTVTLSRFGMQKLLLSNAHFRLFDDPYVGEEGKDCDRFGKDDQPVVHVSWYDAWWFSRFVGEVVVNNQPYRVTLPTEAQWEYSARAGSTGEYFRAKKFDSEDKKSIINTIRIVLVKYMRFFYVFRAMKIYALGSWSYFEVTEDLLPEYAHYSNRDSSRSTLPVSSKLPNLWGLRMTGNALQWTLDTHASPIPGGEDPLVIGGMGSRRVLRGGSWLDDAANCRSAFRDGSDPAGRSIDTGFRVALSPSGASRAAELQSGIEID
jgi:formylglycine-generating enzyme required for sulfatase activity